MADPNDLLTIVLPALNEEEAVEMIIDEVREAGYERILLVDGHSTDRTAELARKRGVEVVLQDGDGKVGGIRTAIQRVDTPYFLVMDCDCTYDPRDIKRFLVDMERYDLIIGARKNGRSNIPIVNRLGNWIITKTFKLLLGSDLTDVCSGMYLLKTDTAKELELNAEGFAVEVEIASQISMNGSVTEVPVSYRKRVGQQKLSRWIDGPKIFNSVFRLARRYNPLFLFIPLAGITALLSSVIFLHVAYEVFGRGWLASHERYVLIGSILLLLSFQAFSIAVFSVLLKRMERRIERRIRGR